ncbi:MAG: HRDC domain-containing protein [Polyangiaceae bacterium]|nr:HRDC domain-containing protein [Polyangiaceae bacterium]
MAPPDDPRPETSAGRGGAHELVDGRVSLERCVAALRGARRLYLDAEFEASREGTRLSLVQVSAGERVWLLDAQRLTAVDGVRQVFAGADEWVLHAAREDVALLSRWLGLRETPALFDTQVAWALLGPEANVSLAYLVYRVLGARTSKAHQTDDWARRPLPAPQLAYAAADVVHLPAIREQLGARLVALGRLAAVAAASREAVAPEPEPQPRLRVEDFRNAWQLDAYGQAALRFLVEWYAALDASERSEAPDQKTLLAIAARLPETAEDLARIKGVSRRWAARRGESLCAAVLRATARVGAEAAPPPLEPPPYATYEELRQEAWLAGLRAALCERAGVAPEVALPPRWMRRLRERLRERGSIAEPGELLEGWRLDVLGPCWRECVVARQAGLAAERAAP